MESCVRRNKKTTRAQMSRVVEDLDVNGEYLWRLAYVKILVRAGVCRTICTQKLLGINVCVPLGRA